MSELMIAMLAFAGATAAQILGHVLEIRRKKIVANNRGMVLVDALAADLAYVSHQLASFVYMLKPSPEVQGWWSFTGSRFDFVRLHRSVDRYDLEIPIAPGVVNRVHSALHQANGLLQEITDATPCTLDDTAKFRAIDLLIYCARLSLLLERSKTSKSVGWHQEISREEVLEFFGSASVYVGRQRVLPEHVRVWMTEIDAKRDVIERGSPAE